MKKLVIGSCQAHRRLYSFTGDDQQVEHQKGFLKKHVRNSKNDPIVEDVDIVGVNLHYALIRNKNGNESTISMKCLAPGGDILMLCYILSFIIYSVYVILFEMSCEMVTDLCKLNSVH